MDDTTLTLPDGRVLAYTVLGPRDAPTAMVFHGAPACRLRFGFLDDAFVAAGVRVVCPDRPGYGGSSPQPGRDITGWPSDVAALADALSVDRFVVGGHSSGGPYAIACAALLRERVSAGVTVGGVTDMGWSGAWDGYSPFEAEVMRVADEAAATALCEERLGADGSGFMAASGFDITGADAALFDDPEMAAVSSESRIEAFRQGVGGYAQDVLVQARPWPFDPSTIAARFVVAHGSEDGLLSVSHAHQTAKIVPGAELRILDGHGHLTILSQLPALLAEAVTGV